METKVNGNKVNGNKVNGNKVNGNNVNGNKVNGNNVNGNKVNGNKVNGNLNETFLDNKIIEGFCNPSSDSLLPKDLFDRESTNKHRIDVNQIGIRYDDSIKEPSSQIYAQENTGIEAIPVGIADRSDIIPCSANSLALIDAVRDAFKKPETFGSSGIRDNSLTSIANRDCTKCSLPKQTNMCPQSANPACQMPTVNNPFMNVMVTDYGNNPNRPPGCNQEIVQNDIDNKWSNNLYRNVNDVWDKNNGQQSYTTQNWTTIPNDQDSFQKWLFTIPYVCKDGTDPEACYRGAELQMPQMRPGKIF